jgi:lathosterol oxidase
MGFISIMGMSGLTFYRYYYKPSYDDWRYKSNPKYPSPKMVKLEIITMIKGMLSATLNPTGALWMARNGYSKGYCGVTEDYPWSYLIGSFFFCWILSDFVEFYYHRMGHTIRSFWQHHKAHHVFFNPSPFAVIADEYLDQFVRASPMLIYPMLFPVNIDMLFFQFAVFFYCYGTYLHSGYEWDILDAHNPIFNTSFQHYIHHAKSIMNKPYHTGFVFKIWDQLFGSVYDQECVCARHERERGKRTREIWNTIHIPDYSVLLTTSFWITS